MILGTILSFLFLGSIFGFVGVSFVTLAQTRKELRRFKNLCDNLSIHLDVDEE